MKKDKLIIYISMFLNLMIGIIKLISGILFNFSSLIADSLQSLFDFVTDVISMIASRVGDRRANKRHPFGYGMIENISNLFIGIVLLLLGCFILYRGFTAKSGEVSAIIFIVLIVSLFLKMLVVLMLKFGGKRYNNKTLLVSAKESLVDLVATVIVLVVSLMLLFEEYVYIFKYADLFGSIFISGIIFYTSFDIIKVNIDYLLGINEDNEEIRKKVNDVIDDYKIIKDKEFKLLKMGDYYTLYLTIELDDSVTFKRIMTLENKLKKRVKSANRDVKYIQIDFKRL